MMWLCVDRGTNTWVTGGKVYKETDRVYDFRRTIIGDRNIELVNPKEEAWERCGTKWKLISFDEYVRILYEIPTQQNTRIDR